MFEVHSLTVEEPPYFLGMTLQLAREPFWDRTMMQFEQLLIVPPTVCFPRNPLRSWLTNKRLVLTMWTLTPPCIS